MLVPIGHQMHTMQKNEVVFGHVMPDTPRSIIPVSMGLTFVVLDSMQMVIAVTIVIRNLLVHITLRMAPVNGHVTVATIAMVKPVSVIPSIVVSDK